MHDGDTTHGSLPTSLQPTIIDDALYSKRSMQSTETGQMLAWQTEGQTGLNAPPAGALQPGLHGEHFGLPNGRPIQLEQQHQGQSGTAQGREGHTGPPYQADHSHMTETQAEEMQGAVGCDEALPLVLPQQHSSFSKQHSSGSGAAHSMPLTVSVDARAGVGDAGCMPWPHHLAQTHLGHSPGDAAAGGGGGGESGAPGPAHPSPTAEGGKASCEAGGPPKPTQPSLGGMQPGGLVDLEGGDGGAAAVPGGVGDEEQEGPRICRFCLEEEGEGEEEGASGGSDPLITPCLCTGTARYVHASCLARWREATPSSFYRCPVCGFAYHYRRPWWHSVLQWRVIPVLLLLAGTAVLVGVLGFLPAWRPNPNHSPLLHAANGVVLLGLGGLGVTVADVFSLRRALGCLAVLQRGGRGEVGPGVQCVMFTLCQFGAVGVLVGALVLCAAWPTGIVVLAVAGLNPVSCGPLYQGVRGAWQGVAQRAEMRATRGTVMNMGTPPARQAMTRGVVRGGVDRGGSQGASSEQATSDPHTTSTQAATAPPPPQHPQQHQQPGGHLQEQVQVVVVGGGSAAEGEAAPLLGGAGGRSM